MAKVHGYIFLQFYPFLNAGEDVSAQSSGSVRIIKGGLHLSISPVTAANQGEYACLVKNENTEMINMYNITVVGEIYTCFYHNYITFILFTHKCSGVF